MSSTPPKDVNAAPRVACPSCGRQGKRVRSVTLRALLKEEFASRLAADQPSRCDAVVGGCKPITGDTGWRFCDAPGCDVVYFSQDGDTCFTKSQLKVPVGVKETTGERPLCYCFGHSVASIKEELRTKGRSDALADIRAKMKHPGCRCETENPSGLCCLGSVTKGIQIAQEEWAQEERTMSHAPTKPAPTPDATSSPATAHRPPSRLGEKIAKIGALLSAILASSCCWLPLVLLAVGVSAAGIAATLETYRPLFIVVTFAFLAAAFYFTYRPCNTNGAARPACCGSQATEKAGAAVAGYALPTTRGVRMVAPNKILLWVVAVLAVSFLFFPSYVGVLFGTGKGAAVTETMNRAVFQIEGMTCEGCATTVAQAIRQVPGVVAVEVSYEKQQAVVGTEACCPVPSAKILAALEKAGYRGKPRLPVVEKAGFKASLASEASSAVEPTSNN